MPYLPTTQQITGDKYKLIESGELSIGEPVYTPYMITKSTVTSTGDIKVESMSIYGRKSPLLDLNSLLVKHKKYMHISMPQAHAGTGANEMCT